MLILLKNYIIDNKLFTKWKESEWEEEEEIPRSEETRCDGARESAWTNTVDYVLPDHYNALRFSCHPHSVSVPERKTEENSVWMSDGESSSCELSACVFIIGILVWKRWEET